MPSRSPRIYSKCNNPLHPTAAAEQKSAEFLATTCASADFPPRSADQLLVVDVGRHHDHDLANNVKSCRRSPRLSHGGLAQTFGVLHEAAGSEGRSLLIRAQRDLTLQLISPPVADATGVGGVSEQGVQDCDATTTSVASAKDITPVDDKPVKQTQPTQSVGNKGE